MIKTMLAGQAKTSPIERSNRPLQYQTDHDKTEADDKSLPKSPWFLPHIHILLSVKDMVFKHREWRIRTRITLHSSAVYLSFRL